MVRLSFFQALSISHTQHESTVARSRHEVRGQPFSEAGQDKRADN
jgi:hypothetical protein